MSSKGEEKIASILRQEKINFVQEYKLKDFRNGEYRLDFWLPDQQIAIEFQGSQHYEFTSYFFKGRSDYLKAKERDRRKISYCLAHDIKIYCIPYWEMDTISYFEDLTRPQYLAKSMFHNDEAWRLQK